MAAWCLWNMGSLIILVAHFCMGTLITFTFATLVEAARISSYLGLRTSPNVLRCRVMGFLFIAD